MSVQVLYKNKAKSGDLRAITIFADEKFQIKNMGTFLSKIEVSYVQKILKIRKIIKKILSLFI